MSDAEIRKAATDAKLKIEHTIDEFLARVDSATSDTESFLTIHELEEEWHRLRTDTDKTYSDLVAAVLSNVDDKELIKAKKSNTSGRG